MPVSVDSQEANEFVTKVSGEGAFNGHDAKTFLTSDGEIDMQTLGYQLRSFYVEYDRLQHSVSNRKHQNAIGASMSLGLGLLSINSHLEHTDIRDIESLNYFLYDKARETYDQNKAKAQGIS